MSVSVSSFGCLRRMCASHSATHLYLTACKRSSCCPRCSQNLMKCLMCSCYGTSSRTLHSHGYIWFSLHIVWLVHLHTPPESRVWPYLIITLTNSLKSIISHHSMQGDDNRECFATENAAIYQSPTCQVMCSMSGSMNWYLWAVKCILHNTKCADTSVNGVLLL